MNKCKEVILDELKRGLGVVDDFTGASAVAGAGGGAAADRGAAIGGGYAPDEATLVAAEIQLLGAVVNIAAALKLAANAHHLERRDLEEMSAAFESIALNFMNCESIDDDATNVTRVLLRRPEIVSSDNNIPLIVQKAMALHNGPLELCVSHDLMKIFSSKQIILHVQSILYDTFREKYVDIVRELPDLFQLRTGCSAIRFRPVVFFLFEGISKVVFLIIVCVVSTYCYARAEIPSAVSSAHFCSGDSGAGLKCAIDDSNAFVGEASSLLTPRSTVVLLNADFVLLSMSVSQWESVVVLIFATSLLYESGEIFSKFSDWWGPMKFINMFGKAWSKHFTDKWNIIDCVTILLIAIWSLFRYGRGDIEASQPWLAMASIPLSLGLLRFLSLNRQIGQLVIMVFEMMQNLFSFSIVFMTFLLGFGIAFHSLFKYESVKNADSDDMKFVTPASTFLTLFDAALGEHSFEIFDRSPHRGYGVFLMVVFIALVMIVLLNLVIARMSATHDNIDSVSVESW